VARHYRRLELQLDERQLKYHILNLTQSLPTHNALCFVKAQFANSDIPGNVHTTKRPYIYHHGEYCPMLQQSQRPTCDAGLT
jgi:hypothetical protein